MAGYDYECWKSNNAIAAEHNGLLKAGELARRLNVSLAAVKQFAITAERHHVGGGYAMVGYYRVNQPAWAIAEMQDFDRRFRPHSLLDVTVRYLQWPSFNVGRYANNRNTRPVMVTLKHCRVTFSTPNTVIILMPAGERVTKRTTTKGLLIEGVDDGI